MARLIRVKNTDVDAVVFVGQTIEAGAYFTISEDNYPKWAGDEAVFAAVANGTLVINNGVDDVDDFTDVLEGWNWLAGDSLPRSSLDNTKLAVHSSSKPQIAGETYYVVWAGAGDDLATGQTGGGDLLHFHMQPGTAEVSKDVRFHPNNGRVWLSEGYLKFSNAGVGDNISASVVAPATPVQQLASLNLEITDNWIHFAAGGPGTGTHGFADPTQIFLIPRPFSKDGHWDYDGVNLTPNLAGTGEYRISDVEKIIHKFMNKIPCFGDCATFFSMSSNDTTELPTGYILRVTASNVSDTEWNASVIMEIYRQRTYVP